MDDKTRKVLIDLFTHELQTNAGKAAGELAARLLNHVTAHWPQAKPSRPGVRVVKIRPPGAV